MERHDKRLTEHFCLDEFTYSGIAVDNAINNQPPPCACLALQNLAVGLLEPLRLLYGAPIAILSGYRNEKVNRLAGGVVTSQHLKEKQQIAMLPMGRKNCWMCCNVPV